MGLGADLRRRVEAGFESWGRLVFRHRWLVLAASLAAVVASAALLPRMTSDNSTESFLLENDPASQLYRDFKKRFGQDDHILIAIPASNVFERSFLERLRDLHRALEDELPYVDEVQSLVNARWTRGEGDTLIVDELMADWPETAEELRAIEERALANRVYLDLLFSRDARLAVIMIRPIAYSTLGDASDALAGFEEGAPAEPSPAEPPFLTREEKDELVAALWPIVARFRASDFEIHVAGDLVTSQQIDSTMRHDVEAHFGLAGLAIVGLLLVLFRRISGFTLPMAVVAASLLATGGMMVALGIPASMPLQMLPVFMMVVGVSNSVHILVIVFQRLNAGSSMREAIVYVFGHSGVAIAMTSATTAAGMSSFLVAELGPMVDLGITATIGVLLALVFTFALLPALLAILPIGRGRSGSWSPDSLLTRSLVAAGDLATRYPRVVLGATAIGVVILAVGALELRVSHSPHRWFPENHPTRLATELIDAKLDGVNSVEVLIDTGRENGLHDPELLRRLDAAMAFAEGFEAGPVTVGKATSIVDVVKETHQALNENRSSHYAIPKTRPLVAQELLLFENSGSDDLEQITDSSFRSARLTLRVPLLDGTEYPVFLEELRRGLRGVLGDEVHFEITGHTPLISRAMSAMTSSMARSYAWSIALITPMMILLIGRFRVGLMSMIPNLLPMLTVLGVMGLFGIPIDGCNIVVGSVIIGLAVDDTIHFMNRFQRDYEHTGDVREAVRLTLSTTGAAMLFTSVVITSGFLVMSVLGSMQPSRVFGALCGVGIVSAFLADLLVGPALLAVFFLRSSEVERARADQSKAAA